MVKSTGSRLLKIFKVIFLNTVTFILTLFLVFVIIPLLVILLTPIYLFRWTLSKTVKFFRPDLRKLLTTRGSAFASEKIYSSPEVVVAIAVQIEGQADLQLLRQRVVENVINVKCPKTGDPLFPEMTENLCNWMGYAFWKPLKSFRIEEHVNYYDNKDGNGPIDYEQFKLILRDMPYTPFSKKRGLWEFVVFPDYIPSTGITSPSGHSVVVIRIHHSLVDGYSLLNLMIRVSGMIGLEEKLAKPRVIQQSACSRFLTTSTFVAKIPFEFTKAMISVRACENNCWKHSENVLRSRAKYGATTEAISVEYMKEIKNCYKVTFTSVVLAMIAGGVRHMMAKEGGIENLPEKVRLVMPLPLPGHPEKFRNYLTGGFVSLPIAEPDPIKRLLKINKKFKKLGRSTLPVTFGFMPVVLGALPLAVVKSTRKLHTTLMLTNMPGASEQSYLLDRPMEEVYFSGSLVPGTVAVSLGFNTYNGKARLAGGAFDTVFPTQGHADELMVHCVKELDILSQAGRV